ncbi:hypothetical protein M0R45_037685 [Rubus argutus]|uniref:Uncharacterized protein n=1 Tax=Rubus argutus TaxID=59490 RepID=A0AAW1W3D3_RUBAR
MISSTDLKQSSITFGEVGNFGQCLDAYIVEVAETYVRQSSGRGLIHPEVVQRLAEKNGISLGIGILSHVRIVDVPKQHCGAFDLQDTSSCKTMANGRQGGDELPTVPEDSET